MSLEDHPELSGALEILPGGQALEKTAHTVRAVPGFGSTFSQGKLCCSCHKESAPALLELWTRDVQCCLHFRSGG